MTLRRLLLLLLVAAIAFSPCLFSSFHFDDYSLFVDPILMSTSGWWEVFSVERTRPLTYLTFWVNLQTVGRDAFSFHLVNLVLHLVAVWLGADVFSRLVGEKAAIAATLIFALHPIQTEAVTYIFARATLLATVLCLLCWRSWLQERYWVAVAYFSLALLAKEEAVCFPVFMVGVDYFVAKKDKTAFTVIRTPLAMMSALAVMAATRLAYAAHVTEGAGVGFNLPNISPGAYLLVQPRVIFEYLRLVVWPSGLNFDRHFPLSVGLDFATVMAWVSLVSVGTFALLRGREVKAAYWMLGFLILIAPTSSVVPLADVFAERRVYLPMVSLSLGLGLLIESRLRLLLPLMVLIFGGLSFERVLIWKNEETLWRDTAEKSPSKIRPKLQLARALGAARSAAGSERLALLREARHLKPSDTTVMTELGVFYLQAGRPTDARREFKAALDANPNDSQALANYGVTLYSLGNLESARQVFARALELQPCNFDARHNAILLEVVLGRQAAADMLRNVPGRCRFTPSQEYLLK